MIKEKIDDRDLVTAYINGDEKAFEALLIRHKDKIYRFINMKVRDGALAQDIFQDAFIKIVNTLKAGNYNEEGKFLPWAMRIAHNLVIDYFRKNNKVKLISESSSQRNDFNIFHSNYMALVIHFMIVNCQIVKLTTMLLNLEIQNTHLVLY